MPAAPPARPVLPGEVRSALLDIVGPAHLLEGDATVGHAVDWTGRFVGTTPAVVRPGTSAEVAAVVACCARAGVALVPQGGNTGMVGGSVPLDGEIVLALRRLDAVGDIDPVSDQLTVGAGVTLATLHRAAARAGLRYGVDIGARDTATLGGTVATNAGGVHVLAFGPTRSQLRGVEAVLGDGSVVRHLSGLEKDTTGYDLGGLLCGSEGTLGVLTAARLRLVPAPEQVITAVVGLASLGDALALARDLRAQITGLEAAEVVLADGVALVERELGVRAPLAATTPAQLLIEVAGDGDAAAPLHAALASATVLDVAVATDGRQRRALWRVREAHSEAIARLGTPHKLDVSLPPTALARFAVAVGDLVADLEPAARCWIFGHLLDGNLHVNVTGLDPDDERVDDAVLRLVAELGGSIAAEHGIGRAKRRWLHLARSDHEIAAFRAVKRSLDPAGILNPGVLLP